MYKHFYFISLLTFSPPSIRRKSAHINPVSANLSLRRAPTLPNKSGLGLEKIPPSKPGGQ